MAYNGSGVFLINSAGQPVVANTVISATVFNALTSDLATGLSTAITKDGQTTITNNIPFGSNKITGLGSGTAAADAANLGQVQSTVAKLITVTGTDTITGSMSPQLTAYAAGQLFYFVANAANTGAVTLNIDSLGAKNITRDGSSALAAGDINSGEVVVVIYDGTRFQMINAANSFGNTTINGTLTVTGNAGFQANVSITSALSVGGVFAVTGAATFTANPTLSGGTANGVLYLNGSKVATSGSALTFDGTTLTAPQMTLTSANGITMNSVSGGLIDCSGNTLFIQFPSSNSLIFRQSGSPFTEYMRLNSTGLGIGTTSPANKLDINFASSTVYSGTTDANTQFRIYNTSNTNGAFSSLRILTRNANDTAGAVNLVGISSSTDYAADFAVQQRTTGGNFQENLRLTHTGNLGIGTSSPGARVDVQSVNNAFNPLQVRYNTNNDAMGFGIANSNGFAYIGYNTKPQVFSDTPIYERSSFATQLRMDNGSFVFNIAGSGTAGNAITFTTAMVLNASGNLGVGTTSPSVRLHASVTGAGIQEVSWLNNAQAVGANVGSRLVFTGTSSNNGLASIDGAFAGATTADGGYMTLSTRAVTSGTLTERARITAGGDLLVAKTSADYTTAGAEIRANGQINCASANIDFLNMYNTTAAAYRFYVSSGGTVFATNTTISAISDQRHKENVRDLDVGLDAIMALKPRKFDWKEGKGKNTKDDRGFIAQEFEQVFPDLVDEWKDPAPEGEEPYKSVRQDLIPVLVKAMQEQQAMINELKAKVAVLENK